MQGVRLTGLPQSVMSCFISDIRSSSVQRFHNIKKKSHLKQSNSLLVSPAVIETEGTNFPALTTTSARKEKNIYCCERVIDLHIYPSYFDNYRRGIYKTCSQCSADSG